MSWSCGTLLTIHWCVFVNAVRSFPSGTQLRGVWLWLWLWLWLCGCMAVCVAAANSAVCNLGFHQ